MIFQMLGIFGLVTAAQVILVTKIADALTGMPRPLNLTRRIAA